MATTIKHPTAAYDRLMIHEGDPIENFNRLIGINNDAINGYREAADLVENDGYKSFFREMVQQREAFVTELANVVTELEGSPENDGNAKGLLHRMWMKVRTAVSDSDKALFDEIERGEQAAIDVYEDVLESALSEEQRTMVVAQLEKIRKAHNKVKSMQS